MEVLTPEEVLAELDGPKCNQCKHLNAEGECPAWPMGIPDEIIFDDAKHDHVYPGQTGAFVFSSRS